MSHDLIILKSTDINAESARVWDVLINPEKIKQYFNGAETKTDWQVGSEIIFKHIYEKQEFNNKGIILSYDPYRLLSYTYWSAFSNTEDKPENYTTITFTFTKISTGTKLAFTQTNFINKEWYQALAAGWDIVLAKIKEIAEG